MAHKLLIKPRRGAKNMISTGANTEVWLDGNKLGGVTMIRFEAKAKQVTKVYMEMFAAVEVEANIAITDEVTEETNLATRKGGLPAVVVLNRVGAFTPALVATKPKSCGTCACGKSVKLKS